MDYVYFLANASLCLRVIGYLNLNPNLPLCSLTVIHQIDGWILRIRFSQILTPYEHGNFSALMKEMGIFADLSFRLSLAFRELDFKKSSLEVMRLYQLAIVSHGIPDRTEIDSFCHQFTMGLGYCPETFA